MRISRVTRVLLIGSAIKTRGASSSINEITHEFELHHTPLGSTALPLLGRALTIVKCTNAGVSSDFRRIPTKEQFQLYDREGFFRRARAGLREDFLDSFGQRIEPEGRNAEEALRD